MSFSSCAKRAFALAVLVGTSAFIPLSIHAAETRVFEAEDGSYRFEYPLEFALDHEFADGTGDVTGVTASSPANGDVIISFVGPWNAGDISEVSEKTQQAIVDEFTKSIAVTPKITFQSSSMTTMFGQPAVDMVFLSKMGLIAGKGTPAVNRYVFTVVDGQAYNFRCVYREDKAAEFASACDLAVSTVKFQDEQSQDNAGSNDAGVAAESGCTKLEFSKRTFQVTELSSALMMKDQSPAAVERLQKAHQEMMAVQARVEDTPSEQDCADISAIAETLK